MFIHRKEGFSLLELILATGILGLIFTMGFVVFRNQLAGTLDSEANIIRTRLGEAQSRAINSMDNDSWGIYFYSTSTPFYSLFRGSNYTGAASSTYLLSNLVEFQNPSLGNNTSTVFSKLRGDVGATTTIVIRLKTDTSQNRIITVSPGGKVVISSGGLPSVPSAPYNLGATGQDTAVWLAWHAPSSDGGSAIADYKVYRATSSGAETFLKSLGNAFTNTLDSGLTNGITYYYKVSAINTVGESPLSTEASGMPYGGGPPGAPTNLVATGYCYPDPYNPQAMVDLTWTAPSGTITGYYIYRQGSSYDSVSGITTQYTDFNPGFGNPNIDYYVTAYNGNGEGPASNTAYATTPSYESCLY